MVRKDVKALRVKIRPFSPRWALLLAPIIWLVGGLPAGAPIAVAAPGAHAGQTPGSRDWLSQLEAQAGANAAQAARLGEAFATGERVPLNAPRALKWYRQALLLGDTSVCGAMADLLSGAPGIAPAPQEAAQLYAQAFAAGERQAAERLGDLFARPSAPWADGRRALQAYRQAESVSALLKLGRILEEGRLVPRDDAAARLAYETAWGNEALDEGTDEERAELGERLALMLEAGRGGQRDVNWAKALYVEADTASAWLRLGRLRQDDGELQAAREAYIRGANRLLQSALSDWREWGTRMARRDPAGAALQPPLQALRKAADAGEPRALVVQAALGHEGVGLHPLAPAISEGLHRAVQAGDPIALLMADPHADAQGWTIDLLRAVALADASGQHWEGPAFAEAREALALELAQQASRFYPLSWRQIDIAAVTSTAQAVELIRTKRAAIESSIRQDRLPWASRTDAGLGERTLIASLFLRKAALADELPLRQQWLRLASEQGSPQAQALLGRSLEAAGHPEQAYQWYLLASTERHPVGLRQRDALGRALPVIAAAAAQERALQMWRATPTLSDRTVR